MSQFFRGLLWDEMPWLLCEESGKVSPLTGEPYLIRDLITVSPGVITYWWRFAWGPRRCWLYSEPCACCRRPFVAYTESDLSERLQIPYRFCNHCTADRKAKNSRVTSKRYRESTRLQPLQKHCKQCGELFQPKRSTALFCSALCRQHHHRGCVSW
jgi:hypothetical protein